MSNCFKNSFRRKKSFTNFKLNLSGWGNDQALELMFHCFQTRSSLQVLSLKLKDALEVDIKTISRLFQILQNLQNLQTLKIKFDTIINRAPLDFVSDSSTGFPSLKHLSLSFTQCEGIKPILLRTLGGYFKHLITLVSMSLLFATCDIDDEGLSELRNALAQFSSLEQLSLPFKFCSLITNNGLAAIGRNIEQMPALKSLFLRCKRCMEIDEEGFNTLKNQIINDTTLQPVKFMIVPANKTFTIHSSDLEESYEFSDFSNQDR